MTLPRAAAIAFAATLLFAAPSLAQQPQPPRADQQATTPPTPLSTLDPARLALDQIEQSIGREGITDARLIAGAHQPRAGARRSARGDRRLRAAPRRCRCAAQAARRSAGRERAAGRSGDRGRTHAPQPAPRRNRRGAQAGAASEPARRRSRRAHHGEAPQLFSRANCSGAHRARSIRPSGCRLPAKVPETVEGVAWLLRSWWSFARDSGGYGRIAAALAHAHGARHRRVHAGAAG